jgi:plastocyanin
MRRHLSLILSLALVAAGAVGFGIASTAASAAPLMGAKVTVKIASGKQCTPKAEFCFSPSNISVSSGTKVTFKNTTFTIHTVTRCSATPCAGVSGGTGTDAGFGSPGTIASGGKYVFKFKGTGTYTYYCQVHGYALMHGTITVT